MNTKLSQAQTRHFLHQVTKVMFLISSILILWSFAASEAQGQKQEIIVHVEPLTAHAPAMTKAHNFVLVRATVRVVSWIDCFS